MKKKKRRRGWRSEGRGVRSVAGDTERSKRSGIARNDCEASRGGSAGRALCFHKRSRPVACRWKEPVRFSLCRAYIKRETRRTVHRALRNQPRDAQLNACRWKNFEAVSIITICLCDLWWMYAQRMIWVKRVLVWTEAGDDSRTMILWLTLLT